MSLLDVGAMETTVLNVYVFCQNVSIAQITSYQHLKLS